MCVCVCVFLFAHSFPCQTNKKSKYQVGSGNVETVDFRRLSPLLVSAQVAGAQHSSVAHIDRTSATSEALPPFPVVFVLVWR